MQLDGSDARIVATHKDSIGYYRWIDKNQLVAFILTKPPSLQWMNIQTKENIIIMQHPGRSIFKYKDGVIVCNKENPDTCTISFVTKYGDRLDWLNLPPGTEDFFLTESAFIFTSNKGKILYTSLLSPDDEWKELIDLTSIGINKITRIAVNKKQNKMAIVVPE